MDATHQMTLSFALMQNFLQRPNDLESVDHITENVNKMTHQTPCSVLFIIDTSYITTFSRKIVYYIFEKKMQWLSWKNTDCEYFFTNMYQQNEKKKNKKILY